MRLLQFKRRWRLAVYSIAVGLPLIAVAITAIAILLDSSGQAPRHSILSQFQDLPQTILMFNWPYIILDFVITLYLRSFPQEAVNLAAKRSAKGALIGMTLPYAFVYSLWPAEMSSSFNDAGQGVGILLVLVGWVIGPICATLGWIVGRFTGKSTGSQDDAA